VSEVRQETVEIGIKMNRAVAANRKKKIGFKKPQKPRMFLRQLLGGTSTGMTKPQRKLSFQN